MKRKEVQIKRNRASCLCLHAYLCMYHKHILHVSEPKCKSLHFGGIHSRSLKKSSKTANSQTQNLHTTSAPKASLLPGQISAKRYTNHCCISADATSLDCCHVFFLYVINANRLAGLKMANLHILIARQNTTQKCGLHQKD